MKALPGFPSGWELHCTASLHCTAPRPFGLPSAVVCLLNREEDRCLVLWNKTPLNTESTLKTTGREASEVEITHLWAWLTKRRARGGSEAPTEPEPLLRQQATPGSPGSWDEAEGKLGSSVAVQHSTAWPGCENSAGCNPNPALTLALWFQRVQ